QSGQDRYTTEIVLDGYNGVMTMLDSRGGGGGGMPPEPDYGAPSGGGGASGPGDDLDDEIPF
ncbi:MAG: single-stranded DNA-binding protein, partial [Rhodospirillales bacterium]|nr:single-stranded DNA-binding protein [Rhodospirillales bacterium]